MHDEALKKRALTLLAQALQQSDIQERNEENQFPRLFGPTVAYWESPYEGEIKVTFSTAYWGSGSLRCSISLTELAVYAANLFSDDDAKVVKALADLLEYLRTTLSLLLPTASQDLLARSVNLVIQPHHELLKGARSLLLDPMISSLENRVKETAKRLRAERGRGGSTARLEPNKRRSLHVQYDEICKIARPIKKDYDATFKRFDESHRRGGSTWEQWQEFWGRYSIDLYRHDAAFLLLFAAPDEPSASEVAYRQLAAQTGHTPSYVETLVLKSRKEAGVLKRRKGRTIKRSK